MAFFPGVLLEYQWSFISDFSWFVITVVTYASLGDTLGRWFAAKVDFITKRHYLLACVIRGAFFTLACLLTFFGVYPELFGATWYLVVGLFFFASTFGYFITLGFRHGADESTVD